MVELGWFSGNLDLLTGFPHLPVPSEGSCMIYGPPSAYRHCLPPGPWEPVVRLLKVAAFSFLISWAVLGVLETQLEVTK